MKYYLLAYSRDLGSRDQVKACLDSLPEVISWRSELPYSFFIQSEADAMTIGQAIQQCVGPKSTPRFLITEIPASTERSWGWLSSWKFLNRQTSE